MSEQPMSSSGLFFLSRAAAGYYGKVPLVGDFVTRRVSQNTISIWDNWLRHGLYEIKNARASTNFIDQHHTTAVWNFVVPPAVAGEQLIGVIGASSDRVGRQFPFTLFKPFFARPRQQFRLDHITPFFMQHGPIIRALQQRQLGLEQLEYALEAVSNWHPEEGQSTGSLTANGDIFEVLNEETTVTPPPGGLLPWSGLALTDIMLGDSSYWWTNQTAGGPLRAFTHSGGLNETLLKLLFEPLHRSQ